MTMNMKAFNPQIRPIILLALLILSSTSCLAGIYKWVDEEGVVHYGQQRPKNTTSKSMDVQKYAPENLSTYKRPGAKNSNAKQTNNKSTDTNFDGDAKPKKKKETSAEKKRRLAACVQARNNLKTMEAIGRIRSKDKDGNTRYLSQKQKEAKMKKTRDLITKHCK